MVLLTQSEGFTLSHDPLRNWLCATWVGRQTPEVLRQNYELILQQVRRKGCIKLLNDSSEDLDGWSSLGAWLAENCFPKLAQSGILAVAWILPIDTRALYDTRKVIAATQQPLIDVFRDIESAYDWLHLWPQANLQGL